MKALHKLLALVLSAPLPPPSPPADSKIVNPKIQEMLGQVSEARIRAILEKLESFGTRNTMSNPDDPVRGVGAARTWILNEFKSYSPRLEVRFDKYRVKKQGQRIFKDVDLYNVVAVLPGTKLRDTQIVIGGNSVSLSLGTGPAGTPAGPGPDPLPGGAAPDAGGAGGGFPTLPLADYEKNAELPAPG